MPSTINRVYDRKIPAALPAHRYLAISGVPRPDHVDLRQWCGAVKDQGAEGACTAHAGASSNEWIHRRYLNSSPIFSPQYTYATELIAQGSFPNDVGSDGTTLCGTLIVNGCCELTLYPYQPGQILQPTAAQDANAAKYRLGAFHGLVGAGTALSVLGNGVPWPVAIGFTVYESFEGDQVATTGIMPLPKSSEQILGGHEVLITGYDVSANGIIRPPNCPPAVLVQNSWGTGWGLQGFFWMPLGILEASDTDLKIVHSGSPWR